MQLVTASVIGFGRIIKRVIKKKYIYIWNYFVQIQCYWKFIDFIDNRRKSGQKQSFHFFIGFCETWSSSELALNTVN